MDTHSFKPKKTSNTKRPRAPIACYRCHHKKVQLYEQIMNIVTYILNRFAAMVFIPTVHGAFLQVSFVHILALVDHATHSPQT